MNVTATRPRYRVLHADDGWRIYDDGDKRWSEVMDRDRARRMARLLNEAPGRDEHVRWDVSLSAKSAPELFDPGLGKLAEPTLAVNRAGDWSVLRAGTEIDVLTAPDSNGTAFIAARSLPFTAARCWYVTLAALRFEEAG